VNASEQVVREELEQRGFTVYRNGWPDFLAVRKTQLQGKECLGVMGIEVKSGKDKLSEQQAIIHRILRQARFPIHVVSTQTIKDLKPTTRTMLTEREIFDAHTGLKGIAEEINRLQKRIEELSKVVDGTHYLLESIGPLMTIENF
jgi:hypothetical protein